MADNSNDNLSPKYSFLDVWPYGVIVLVLGLTGGGFGLFAFLLLGVPDLTFDPAENASGRWSILFAAATIVLTIWTIVFAAIGLWAALLGIKWVEAQIAVATKNAIEKSDKKSLTDDNNQWLKLSCWVNLYFSWILGEVGKQHEWFKTLLSEDGTHVSFPTRTPCKLLIESVMISELGITRCQKVLDNKLEEDHEFSTKLLGCMNNYAFFGSCSRNPKYFSKALIFADKIKAYYDENPNGDKSFSYFLTYIFTIATVAMINKDTTKLPSISILLEKCENLENEIPPRLSGDFEEAVHETRCAKIYLSSIKAGADVGGQIQ